MKPLQKTMMAMCMSSLMLVGCGAQDNPNVAKVGVAQIVSHTSLNEIRDAFAYRMEELGYKEGENIEISYQDASNQASNLNPIMAEFSDNQSDVIVAIATKTAQAAANYADEIPVVFSAVSDPEEAGLVHDFSCPDQNITGTCDEIQIDQMLSLATTIQPQLKKIGFLYDAAEANSVSNLKKAKAYCKENGIEWIEATGRDLTELQSSLLSLLDRGVDAVFSPNDNTVASGLMALTDLTKEAKIPYYVGADSMVQDGGFATVGINYTQLGRDTADMVDQILKGKSVEDIPVKVFKEDLSIYVSEEYLDILGMTLPESILKDENLEMMK